MCGEPGARFGIPHLARFLNAKETEIVNFCHLPIPGGAYLGIPQPWESTDADGILIFRGAGGELRDACGSLGHSADTRDCLHAGTQALLRELCCPVCLGGRRWPRPPWCKPVPERPVRRRCAKPVAARSGEGPCSVCRWTSQLSKARSCRVWASSSSLPGKTSQARRCCAWCRQSSSTPGPV